MTLIEQAQRDLWTLRQLQPLPGEGPLVLAISYLIDEISEALLLMKRSEESAFALIPTDIKAQIDQATRRFGPGEIEEVASLAPEVRRYVAVCRVRELVEWLQEDLQNEGKPQGKPDLRLVRQAKGDQA